MLRVLLAAALLTSACWTGADSRAVESTTATKPAEREPVNLRVKLERTGCFGNCPSYSVVIDGSGRVDWIGHQNVMATGRRQGSVTRGELEELSRHVDRVLHELPKERLRIGELRDDIADNARIARRLRRKIKRGVAVRVAHSSIQASVFAI